jgi:hypothetical protein
VVCLRHPCVRLHRHGDRIPLKIQILEVLYRRETGDLADVLPGEEPLRPADLPVDQFQVLPGERLLGEGEVRGVHFRLRFGGGHSLHPNYNDPL